MVDSWRRSLFEALFRDGCGDGGGGVAIALWLLRMLSVSDGGGVSDGDAGDTGDKDPNTHQAHTGYIGSTDNK